jgi:mono/diheme cytochrome c family protein
VATLVRTLLAQTLAMIAVGALAPCAVAQTPLFRQGPAPEFTAEQAGQGQALYAQSCAQCHGEQLTGAVAPRWGLAHVAPCLRWARA